MTTAAAPAGNPFSRFVGKFAVLGDAIPELWLSFVIKCVGIAGYALMNSTVVLWLHSDLKYRDDNALWIVGAWSVVMTFMTLLVGSLTDVLGLRRTLWMGTIICILGRATMIFCTIRPAAIFLGLVPVAIGEAMGGPVLVAAARRYSNTRQRSMSFAMIYGMMNLGFFIAGWLFDYFRKTIGEHGQVNFAGMHYSTYQILFFVSLLLEVLQLPFILMLREGAEATDEGLKITPQTPTPKDRSYFKSATMTMSRAARETLALFQTLLSQSGFYRLLAFLCLIAFVKLIYRQMDYVYPTFGVRELGPGAPVGVLWGMNSLFIIILAPIIGVLTQRFAAYSMVIVGGLISSASIFIMALPPAMFAPFADGLPGHLIGHTLLGLVGPVHPYYVMIMLFVLVLSIGEAFYSPRVYEYAASIAPKGQEASYGALSYIPLLLAKMLITLFSGKWLMRYCPETGPRHSETMWLFVALFSLVAPIGLFLLRPWIQVHEAGREDDAPPAK